MTYTLEYLNPADRDLHQPDTQHLVLMLHGYGSQERDLLQIGEFINGPLVWAGMRAPQPVGVAIANDAVQAHIPGAALGYQWYPLDAQLETPMHAIELASTYVENWLENHAGQYATTTLLGFSQGMAVATSVARRRPDLVQSIVGLSGYVVEGLPGAQDEHNPLKDLPTFYGFGTADPIIPREKVDFSKTWLAAHTALEQHAYPGMGHSICAEEIMHIDRFLHQKVLGKEALL